MTKSLNVLVFILLGISGTAYAKRNNQAQKTNAAKTEQIVNTLIENCVDIKMENEILDTKAALANSMNSVCEAIKKGGDLRDRRNPLMAMGQAALEVVNIANASCIESTLDGHTINSPADLKNIDLQEIMTKFSDRFSAKYKDQSCDPAQFCSNPNDPSVTACQTTMYFDSLRTMANHIATAEFSVTSAEPAREQLNNCIKSIMSEAATNMLMSQGYYKK